MLTQEQIDQFHREGYLLLPDFFDSKKSKQLYDDAIKLVQDFDLAGHPKTVFKTGVDEKHVDGEYFLNSGDKIRYFFEEKSFQDGKLVVDKEKSVNKVGHALHVLHPTFREFSFQQKVKDIAQDLKLETPAVLQSMIIYKQPKIGGEVTPHQDSTFLYTEPNSAIGFWFALEDCTPDNGCLWFIPGSHKDGLHDDRRMIRTNENFGVTFTAPARNYKPEDFVCGECKAGTLVLIHGAVIHKSEENRSPKSRLAYTFHLIEDPSGGKTVYPADNWLQPTPEMPFSLLFKENV